jgi:hypothetical protein
MENNQNTYFFKKYEIKAAMSNFFKIIHQFETNIERVYNIEFNEYDKKLSAFWTNRNCIL